MREYSHFARKDPARLHSEEYLIEQQRLMIETKSERNPVNINDLPLGENPELRQVSDLSSSDEA